MKILKKIITFLLLSILLSSSITGLHFYIVDHDEHHNHCCHHDHDDDSKDGDSKDDAPCNLCLLTFNLSNLNFHSPNPISFEINRLDIQLIKNEILTSFDIFYNHYTFRANRNKAPPALT